MRSTGHGECHELRARPRRTRGWARQRGRRRPEGRRSTRRVRARPERSRRRKMRRNLVEVEPHWRLDARRLAGGERHDTAALNDMLREHAVATSSEDVLPVPARVHVAPIGSQRRIRFQRPVPRSSTVLDRRKSGATERYRVYYGHRRHSTSVSRAAVIHAAPSPSLLARSVTSPALDSAMKPSCPRTSATAR